MAERVVVTFGDQPLTGWESVQVSRLLGAASGTFSVRATPNDAFQVDRSKEVRVLAGDDLLLRGHVDRLEALIDATQHTVTVMGRDLTGDLVDCSPIEVPLEWHDAGASLRKVATAIAGPYGVEVVGVDSAVDEPWETFAIQPGETCWEAIDRGCRLLGVLPYPDREGRLVLGLPDELPHSGARLELRRDGSGNVLQASGVFDQASRFRTYVAQGQRRGDDDWAEEEAATPEGTAQDEAVRAPRTLVLVSEAAVDPESATRRAQNEAAVRAARGTQVTVAVQGWRLSEGGRLWQLAELVDVVLEPMRIEGRLLVDSVTFEVGVGGGTRTLLGLVRPDAYRLAPVVPKVSQEQLRAYGWGD